MGVRVLCQCGRLGSVATESSLSKYLVILETELLKVCQSVEHVGVKLRQSVVRYKKNYNGTVGEGILFYRADLVVAQVQVRQTRHVGKGRGRHF